MSETEKSNGVFSRVAGGTGRAAKRLGKVWVSMTFGDVRGEIDRKRELYAWFKRRLSPGKGRQETFLQAMARLKISSEQLEEREASLARMQTIYGVGSAVAFLVLLLSPMVARPMSQFLMAGGVMCMCVAKVMVCRFRLFEIRERRFVTFLDWMMGRV